MRYRKYVFSLYTMNKICESRTNDLCVFEALGWWVFVLDRGVFVLDQWVFVLDRWVFVLDQRVFILDQWVFVLDQWVFVLDRWVFVLDQWVFVLDHWVLVLDHRVFGLRSLFLGLRFRHIPAEALFTWVSGPRFFPCTYDYCGIFLKLYAKPFISTQGMKSTKGKLLNLRNNFSELI